MCQAIQRGLKTRGDRRKNAARDQPSVKWLDVGCGDGTLLQRAAKRGWTVRGVERYPKAARSRGLTVFDSLSAAANDGPYDGVSLWHVLEHLSDPGGDLAMIRSMLKPDGVLLIAVPDAKSFAARWFGTHWLHWDVPRHLFHFSSQSLSGMLGNLGYQANHLCVSEFEFDLMGFVQSALNRLGLHQNSFFKILTKRPVPLSRGRRMLHLAVGGAFCVVAAGPVWLSGKFGRGGTLVFEARLFSKQAR